MNSIINHVYELAQGEEVFVNTCMYLYFNEFLK